MKFLFVCTGNICRSPTAHGVFRDMAEKAGKAVICDSAGTHAYHVGELPDARTRKVALKRGYDLSTLRARKIAPADFEYFDHILCMDRGHYEILLRIAPSAHAAKVQMFDSRDVPDPYYGGPDGFEAVLDQVEAACQRWIADLQDSK